MFMSVAWILSSFSPQWCGRAGPFPDHPTKVLQLQYKLFWRIPKLWNLVPESQIQEVRTQMQCFKLPPPMRDSNSMFIVGTPKKFKTFLVTGLIVWPLTLWILPQIDYHSTFTIFGINYIYFYFVKILRNYLLFVSKFNKIKIFTVRFEPQTFRTATQ
jgi:hypothetical protein